MRKEVRSNQGALSGNSPHRHYLVERDIHLKVPYPEAEAAVHGHLYGPDAVVPEPGDNTEVAERDPKHDPVRADGDGGYQNRDKDRF